jgi:hypothetical protein
MATAWMKTARSAHADPNQVAEDLLNQLGGCRPKLVTLFAERRRDQRALNRAVRERLPKDTRLIGCTSDGEIDNQGMHFGTVVLGALGGDFDVGLGLGKQLSHDAIRAGEQAMRRASEELGVRPGLLDPRRHLGVVIDDGYRAKKEELLLGIMERNQALVLVGGGAADSNPDMQARTAELHVDGEVATDCALLALFSTTAPWAALRHHAFLPTTKSLTITKVDDSGQRALAIDGKPAAARYAELLGVEIPDLEFGKPHGFSSYPTAQKVGNEYFIRGPYQVLPDGSIFFVNLLTEDSQLVLMERGDMAQRTAEFFRSELPRRVKNPSAALLWNCGARAWIAATSGALPALSESFASAPPAVGYNCNFEIYCGFHINSTLTVLAFGSQP